MRLFIVSVVVMGFVCGVCRAQQVKPRKYVARFAGSVVLSQVQDKYDGNVYSLEMPDPDGNADQKLLRAIKAQIATNYPYKKTRGAGAAERTTAVLPAPTIGINFVADSNSGIPPDNYSAIGVEGQTVNVMNEDIAVHNSSTGAYVLRKNLYSFSLVVGLNNTVASDNNFRYDPKVVYDPVADRYICVMLNGEDQYNWIIMAFSQSNDPTAGWNFYKFYGDYANDTTWFDYPAISVTQNEFFLTGNKVSYDSSWQAGFTRSVIYQVNKSDGYNGDTALSYQIWDSIEYNGGYLRCLYPLNPSVSLLGPGQYFLSNRDFAVNNDTTFIVQVTDTIGASDIALTVTPVVSSTASYGVPPDARQPDTSLSLATNDNRVLGGFINNNEMQFVCTSLDPSNGGSAIYHGVIDNFTTAPVMHAQLLSNDTMDFGYPNISYAGMPGQSIISFDYSGPNIYPGFAAVFSDGTNYSDMTAIVTGDTTINQLPQKEQRWGDYSGTQPQWNAPGTVWVEGIFGKKENHLSGNYGNYMAQLNNPFNVSVPVVNPIAMAAKLYPNPVMAYVNFEFTVSRAQNFSFMVFDMQGNVVDKILDNYCQTGKNIIQFNTAALKPGTYLLKATGGSDGESIAIRSFVRE